GAPEVEMPAYLRAQHPEEITIVLQHQFWNLLVDEVGFSVDLSFSGKREHLYIPFTALVSFVDPSAEFGLQFGKAAASRAEAEEPGALLAAPEGEQDQADSAVGDAPQGAGGNKGEKIISLDQFRKK
ncbi:MAG TPA: ClpXP protease specificity-enhancing factor SspB, partial [Alphaproteobacteria bacterium]|nr:ClpXP protease specificity-enhancing factor SspB [Alphaproteobacteria bacterium]